MVVGYLKFCYRGDLYVVLNMCGFFDFGEILIFEIVNMRLFFGVFKVDEMKVGFGFDGLFEGDY